MRRQLASLSRKLPSSNGSTPFAPNFRPMAIGRITAQLRRDGLVTNHKKVMCIMRGQGLSVRPRRRDVLTTDSDHDGTIFPNLAKTLCPIAPDVLWVADLSYIAIARGFVDLAVILDAWSRRVVGYASPIEFEESRARLTVKHAT